MALKLVLFLVLFCTVGMSLAEVYIENAPVFDPELIAQGYTCYTDGAGAMKPGQVINDYFLYQCGKVTCGQGSVTHEYCEPKEYIKDRFLSTDKPRVLYPECCADSSNKLK